MLGYKDKKKSTAAKYLQKFIDRIDRFSGKKPALKKVKEETLSELSKDSLERYVDTAKKTGSKLDLSPYGKRARGIHLAKKKIAKKEKINELSTVKMWQYLDKASRDKTKNRREGIQKAMWKIANAPTPKYKEETQNEGAYDFPPPRVTILSQTKHLASKSHKCGVCHDEIPHGEVHHRIVYKDHNNGDAFRSYRYHGKCTNVKEEAPTNSMGASSSTSGPVNTYDPLLQRKKLLKRIKSLWSK